MKPFALIAILAVLSSCQDKPTADAVIADTVWCESVVMDKYSGPGKSPKDTMEQREFADLCVRRNAYRYAAAAGDISDIAQAAVKACEGPIINIVSMRVPIAKETRPLEERYAEVESERDEMLEKANLYVVQSRAGNCDLLLKVERK